MRGAGAGGRAARDRAGRAAPASRARSATRRSAAATSSCSGSGDGPSIGGPVVEQVVGERALPRRDHEGAACAPATTSASWSRSTAASRRAWRSSWRCATPRRPGAELALAVLTERRPQAAAYADMSGTHVPAEVARHQRRGAAAHLDRRSAPRTIKPNILHLAFDPRSSAVAQEVEQRALRPGRPRRREPRHPAPAVLRLRERAPDPRHARPGRGRRPEPVAARRRTAHDGAQRRAPRLILIGGGARSGKSRFALARATALGRAAGSSSRPPSASDDEMRDRIARHRAERGAAFDTLEEPLRAARGAGRRRATHDVILVDCLTLWISNLLVRGAAADEVDGRDRARCWPALAAPPGARRARQQRGRDGPGARDAARARVPRRGRARPPAPRGRWPTSSTWRRWAWCCGCARRRSRWSTAGERPDAVVAAFAFLTRLPVWRGPLRDADLGRSVGFFPLVGLVLGLALDRARGRARRQRVAAGCSRCCWRRCWPALTGGAAPRRVRRRVRRARAAAAAIARACWRSCATAASAPTARRPLCCC